MPAPANSNPAALTADALETAVRAADPCALLLPPWFLEKLVAADRGPAINVFSLSRVQSHVIARDRFLAIVADEELPLDAPPPAGDMLILLARPDGDALNSTPPTEMLRRYWRLLFHTRVRGAVTAAIAAEGAAVESSPIAAVQRRIEDLGRTTFNEARAVLQRERYTPYTADDADVYAQFAATYLDLAHFAPPMLPWFFPATQEDAAGVRQLLARDVDADALLRSTRPAGVDAPADSTPAAPGATTGGGQRELPRRVRRDAAHRDALLAKAAAADALGNDVRAALLRMRVYRASGTPGPGRDNRSAVYADALKDLDQLTTRLKAALELDDSRARQWRAWLVELLENAATGWWNAEGRLLYDLQKVCVYHEREIYSVNVVDYLVDLRRRPLRRSQPGQRIVLTLKALRSALRRTARARLSPHGRSELQRLLQSAIQDVEGHLREFLSPGVAAALEGAGLQPQTATETVARAKLTEELLDEIVDNGYLTFPAVRDAVSRSQMKLNDLASRRDFVRGDQLLRVDRHLEDNLDYVYRRGEIYLRGFHRLSSIFFGTHVGRLLTKAAILPFGGAFVILEALDHSVGLLIHKIADKQHVVVAAAASATQVFGPTPANAPPPAHAKIFSQWWLLLALGVFLFGVINLPRFRAAVGTFFRQFGRALRATLIDVPRWVATRPIVQAFFRSRFARLFFRYVFKPLLFAAVVYDVLPDTVSDKRKTFTLAGVFLVVNVLLNSRAGRALEQAVLHSLRTTLARFTWDVLVSIVRRIVQVFQSLLEAVDRLLYAVDELLRFRAGQKRATVAFKATLGVFWFFVAYVTRFVINLLVEPQINPIKHFPVVTVSHKLLFPLIVPLRNLFLTVGLGEAQATSYAVGIIWCIPGIFGFLAWEFKENWKLYKANRSANLKPVRVGSHGETVATFLRPGFHSGTVPKIYHKLRKAQERSPMPLASSNKHLEAAHHVELALVAFFEREFLAQLNRHPLFRDTPISLGHVRLGVTTIRADFLLDRQTLALSFEQRAGWIIARIEQPGWAASLSDAQARQFEAALGGLYKLAGVDLIHEHLQSLFPDGARFDFRNNDLLVWPAPDFSVQAVYHLTTDDRPLAPHFSTTNYRALPALRPHRIFFRQTPFPRAAWVALWEPTAQVGPALLPDVVVMPKGEPVAEGVAVNV